MRGDIVIKYIIYLNSSVIIRVMGTAKWAKCMLCKYEDLSSDPKNPCIAGLGSACLQSVPKALGGRDRRIPEVHGPASLSVHW